MCDNERDVVSLLKRKKLLEETLARDFQNLAQHDIEVRQAAINALSVENRKLIAQYRLSQRTKLRRSLVKEDPTSWDCVRVTAQIEF